MAAVSRIARDRGIHEETSTGTAYNIGTVKTMASHQSTARIPPIRAAIIPEVRKLDRPVSMEGPLCWPYFIILLTILLRKYYALLRHPIFIRTMLRGRPPLNMLWPTLHSRFNLGESHLLSEKLACLVHIRP